MEFPELSDTLTPPRIDTLPRRLRGALERRSQLVDDPRYCRIVNGAADGLPGLVVDRFRGHFAVQTTTSQMDHSLEAIGRTLVEVAEAESVIVRNDGVHRQKARLPTARPHVLVGTPPRWTRLLELGARLTFDLHQGEGTGYAYALREVRRAVGRLSLNATVLDPWCLVGGTVVQAGLHGAKRILAFDPDPDATDLARENAEANGLSTKVHIETLSATQGLRALDERFDLVVLHGHARLYSPPESSDAFDDELLRCIRLTRRGGRLVVAATDAALGAAPLEAHVLAACTAEGRSAVRLLRPAAPVDFPTPAGAPDPLAAVVLEIR